MKFYVWDTRRETFVTELEVETFIGAKSAFIDLAYKTRGVSLAMTKPSKSMPELAYGRAYIPRSL